MASRKIAKKQTVKQKKPKTKLEEIEHQAKSIVNQISGLQSFLRALGEAHSHQAVVDINDLTFGFSYLLDATQTTAKSVQSMLAQLQKGGRS